MIVTFSHTARQTGFGSDWFKKVTYLSRVERALVQAGGLVVFNCGRLSGGHYGTPWRVVVRGKWNDYYPRVPSIAQLSAISDALARQAQERLLDPTLTDEVH